MSVIAEFTVPAEQFALSETLAEVPEMVVEVERVVAHEPDRIMPYFWTSGGDAEEFEAAAADDPSVEDLTKLDDLDEAILYRANWVQNIESVVYAYTETGAVLLSATGRDGQWELELRFDAEDDVMRFKEYMNENDLSMDLTRLYHPSSPTSESVLPYAHRDPTRNGPRGASIGVLRDPPRDETERAGRGVGDIVASALEAVSTCSPGPG
jgi:hypothetical protein